MVRKVVRKMPYLEKVPFSVFLGVIDKKNTTTTTTTTTTNGRSRKGKGKRRLRSSTLR